MNWSFIAFVVIPMSVIIGYIAVFAVQKIRQVWRLYVVGRELKDRWDDEVVDLMAGDKNEHD